MTYRQELWDVAAGNHGVLTVTDAEDAGVPAVQVRQLAARGALQAYGNGVYVHQQVPATEETQPALAVALAGAGAFLEGESVLDLMGLGQFNPRWIRVGTRRRVRRALPDWMRLARRSDVRDADLTAYRGIPALTVERAIKDLRGLIPGDRWRSLLADAVRLGLVEAEDVRHGA